MMREPKEPIPTTPSIDDIKREYRQSVPAGDLKRGMKRDLSNDYLLDVQGVDGQRETLNGIILVGDSALGVSKSYGPDGSISDVRVSVLPIGEHAGSVGNRQSSSTLLQLNPSDLHKVRENGTVQPWEDVVIGREAIAERTGSVDNSISREHFVVRVLPDGNVTVIDRSTNGTTVLAEIDVLRDQSVGGLPNASRRKIAEFIEPLAEAPWTWQKSSADKRVINPY